MFKKFLEDIVMITTPSLRLVSCCHAIAVVLIARVFGLDLMAERETDEHLIRKRGEKTNREIKL